MSREYLTVQSQIWWKVAVTKAVNSHSQLISSACQSGCRVQICHSNWKCVKLLTCHDKALDVARGRKEYEKLLPKQRKAVQAFISVFAYRDLSFVHRVWTVLCGRRNLVDNNNYWRPKHSYKITLIMTYQCWVMLIEVVRFCSQTITLSSIQEWGVGNETTGMQNIVLQLPLLWVSPILWNQLNFGQYKS